MGYSAKPIKLGKYKKVSCNIYKKKVYAHIGYTSGRKSLTFSPEEIKLLEKKLPEILTIVEKLKTRVKNRKLKKQASGKHPKKAIIKDDSSDSQGSSNDEEEDEEEEDKSTDESDDMSDNE